MYFLTVLTVKRSLSIVKVIGRS